MTASNVVQFRSPSGRKHEVDISEYLQRDDGSARIVSASDSDLAERAWALIQQKDDIYGDQMPWSKTHQKMRFRPGEVTAWIGPNRDGKSLLTGYLAALWAIQETPVTVYSLEMDVAAQLKRLSRQFLCTDSPIRSLVEMLFVRLNWLRIYDDVGRVPPDRMLALVRYSAASSRHVLVDNLTIVVPPSRSSDEQSANFVRGLVEIARETQAHIHLVAHVRKPEEDRLLTRYDWRGTGACSDMVHNVIILQANERKRRAADKGDFSRAAEGDVLMTVDKQRNGEFHGRWPFWWRPAALQLVQYGNDDAAVFDPHDFSGWER